MRVRRTPRRSRGDMAIVFLAMFGISRRGGQDEPGEIIFVCSWGSFLQELKMIYLHVSTCQL